MASAARHSTARDDRWGPSVGDMSETGVRVDDVSSNPRVITVGYYAAAEDAAGTAREHLHTAATTVGELAREVCERHGEPLASIVTVSSFLVGDETTRDPNASIASVSEVDVLPPFAGG